MIEIQNRGDCSGCAACAAACPRQAIEMNADQEGFLYPVINSAKCMIAEYVTTCAKQKT